ncbi:MAG: hypothetical protein COB93_00050 [Sneathiella sp.]|nr:MAG: hypothetical protein COB93_00050 [Sneathiella sp.]
MTRAVTVLIVTHQSEEHLDQCLRSLALAAPKSRLIIRAWDNASNDGSVAKLQDAGVTVITSEENIGFGAAVNRLASGVGTPFIFLLNPDAAPKPEAIDVLIDAAMAMPDREMFCGRTVFPDGRDNPTSAWGSITPRSALLFATGLSMLWPHSPWFAPEALNGWDRLSDREVDIATGCALLVRTATWKALGGFDERYWLYGEETEMQLRMVRSGFNRPWFVSSATFVHKNSAVDPPGVPLEARTSRSLAALKGRATLMRHTWRGLARWTAAPILWLNALRYGTQSLLGGPKVAYYRALWRSRADWTRGYPPPNETSGALSLFGRVLRLAGGVLDPRAYLHALRIVNFYNYAHARPRRELNLGDDVEITPNVTFYNATRISIGSRTVIAARVSLMAGGVHGRIFIGQDCMIGPDALVTAANYRGDPEGRHRSSGMREINVILEDNVWIGAGAVVLPGVRIGRGAIIGASTVVSENVPPGAVLVGAATRKVRDGSLPWVSQKGNGDQDNDSSGAP